MSLRLTREADSTKFGFARSEFLPNPAEVPPSGGVLLFWVLLSPERGYGTGRSRIRLRPARVCRYFIELSRGCRKTPIAPALPDRRAVPSFASIPLESQGASFLRSRHASGITARAAEGTPLGGVAKRSTARLRAVAGASTLLGWGHGRRQNDLRRPLAALRMSAALPPTA